MNATPASRTRPIKVGVHILQVDGPPAVGWRESAAIALRAEELGFDSISMGDHLVMRFGDMKPLGVWDCWTFLTGLAAITSRIQLETLVASTAYRNPALIAKIADSLDEVSGGRFVLGIGAGWHEPEFHAFGFPYDHRVSRFEEAITIISGLLRDRAIDFEGQYATARDCALLPTGPRPQGPPILVGGGGDRILHLTARYADAWNADLGTNPDTIGELNARVDGACRDIGRDPATLERTAFIAVNVSGPSLPGDAWKGDMWQDVEFTGPPDALAATLRAYAAAGIHRVQVALNPCTVAGVEAFAPVLDVLDAVPAEPQRRTP